MALRSTPLFPFTTGLLVLAVLLLSSSLGLAQFRFLESGRKTPDDVGMGLLAKSPTKYLVDLNGKWQYREAEDDVWYEVRVPSSCLDEGKMVFRKHFYVQDHLLGKSVFQFAALSIAHYCEVRINDHFVGKHTGAASFSLKISPGVIRGGNNVIEILVSSATNASETVPLRERIGQRLYYGGLIQDLAIVATGPVWVQETYARTEQSGEGKPGTINYRALLNSGQVSSLRNDTASVAITFGKTSIEHVVEVVDMQTGEMVARSVPVRAVIESDRLITVDLSVTVPSARLWSPESPNTYLLRQKTYRGSTLVDESYQVFGFRKFAARDGMLTLNGSPYFIKSVAYVDDSPWRGRSLSMDEIERDVLLIKNLGANAVRLTDGMVHPYFLALCDRYGILVFQDLPVQQVPNSILFSQAMEHSARNTLREFLARDANHPSVVAYGFGQGLDGRGVDPSSYFRYLKSSMTGGTDHLVYASFSTIPNQPTFPDLDFLCLDLLPTDSRSVLAALGMAQSVAGSRPVLAGTLTYPVEIGNNNGYSDPRSVDAQAQFYLELYPEILGRKFAGIVVNAFSDWRVRIPIMSVDRVHQFTYTTGLVDWFRQKRLVYDVLKAKFNNEKPPVVVIGNYTVEHPVTFVFFGILLIAAFALMYHLFRRFRENVVRSFLRPFNFFSDVRDQRMLSIFQTTVIGVLGCLSAALIHANMLYYWRLDPFTDLILYQLLPHVWIKQWLNFSAWNPFVHILVMTVLLFAVLMIYTLLLRLVSFLFKKKLLLFDTYSVAMWSVLPMALLAPFGMVLYRLMELPVFETLALVTIVGFHIWVFSRILKGTAIVLDIRPVFFYLGGFVLLAAVGVAILISMNNDYRTFSHLSWVLDVWWFLRFTLS